jgi:exodeoxyribonuclease VII large subunit
MALDNPTILTVTQLNNQVKSQMETRFKNLWIQGEISSPKKYPSGHTYLTLKDSQSEISSVLFSGSGRNIDFQILHGLKVIAYGQPSIFIRRGQYQFIIENMYPAGKGELWLSFEQLKKRLVNEGLFDQKFKRNISLYPRRIGVLTSGSGSVLRDIINVINRRAPHINILVRPVQVQGEAAVDDIRRGLKEMNEHGGVDTIILGRGGGSMEDLWCFNDESLARDIFHSRLPVISAVGHETDFTISDFVADHRAPTPSAAAEIAVPKQADLVQILDDFQKRMSARM